MARPASLDPAIDVVLATNNPGKVAELRPIFAALGLRVIGLGEVATPTTEPAEDGTTFLENATIKARGYAVQVGRPCLADDSGLIVDALGGRPGVISSHFATDGRETGASRGERDAANNARLLRELEGVPADARSARFVCAMVLVDAAGGLLATAEGTFEGRIGVPPAVPAGDGGFGYDPLFLVAPAFNATSAQLGVAEKNRISHRAAAAGNLVRELQPRIAR
ncbi:MAG: non-canonical purine NTP pyrophosphatase [Planctomycetota bacterium]